MPHFLVHTQQGGGCGYTIGCGHRINIIVAADLRAAYEKVRREWFGLIPEALSDPKDDGEFDGIYTIRSNMNIEKVTIYEIRDDVVVDVAGLFREVGDHKAAREKAAKEARDRAQYEALKARFEPKS